MDSIGNVVAAPVIDGIAKLLHTSTSANPLIAFKICMYLSFAGLIVVIIRKLILAGKNHDDHRGISDGTTHVGSVQPMAVGVASQSTVSAPKASAVESAPKSQSAPSASAAEPSATSKSDK